MRRVGMTVVTLALAGCGGGSTKTVTVLSTSSTTQVASSTTSTTLTGSSLSTVSTSSTTTSTTTAGPPLHLSTFRSPSANIGCVLVGGFARCDIAHRSWTPPSKPASCPLDYGQGVEVGRSGSGHLVCAGDTALNPQATPLGYGQASQVGPIRCASATTGMTCSNTGNGHGFFISAQSYRSF